MCSSRVSAPLRMLLFKAYGFPGGVGQTVNAPLILPTRVTTTKSQQRYKSSPADEYTFTPHNWGMLFCWRHKCQRGGEWLAAGGQRRTSRTHHHPCCGVLCINRLEVAEQGLCDTFGHNIYLIKLPLPWTPSLIRIIMTVIERTWRILGFSISRPLANIFGITIKEMRNNNETRWRCYDEWRILDDESVCLSVSAVNCLPYLSAEDDER